jgi:prophage regulatory protein
MNATGIGNSKSAAKRKAVAQAAHAVSVALAANAGAGRPYATGPPGAMPLATALPAPVPPVKKRGGTQPLEAAMVPGALLTVKTVSAITGLSAATIYRKVASGNFPPPIKLGLRCTRFGARSVTDWTAAQVAG